MFDSKDRAETEGQVDRQTDTTDRITLRSWSVKFFKVLK